MECGECRFSEFGPAHHYVFESVLHCKRRAPDVIGHQGSAVFPKVGAHNWCGDFEELLVTDDGRCSCVRCHELVDGFEFRPDVELSRHVCQVVSP